jgi:hypothetical protein
VSDRPLHVRVAEALGWWDCAPETTPNEWTGKQGTLALPPGATHVIWNGVAVERAPESWGRVPHFDTDWAVTGPLIESHRISLDHDGFGMWKAYLRSEKVEALGRTPLVAVCELLLMLATDGKL